MQGTETGPRTWLVVGDKGGDNAQVATIAEQLPWPYETRFVAMRPRYVKGKPRVRPSLHHLDLEASDAADGEREVAERILSELYDKDQQAYDELIASFEGRRLAPAPEMLQLFLLGMALCFLRQRSGGLTIPVLAHFAVTAFTDLGTSLI